MVREQSHSHIQAPQEQGQRKERPIEVIETPAPAANCDRSHRDDRVHTSWQVIATRIRQSDLKRYRSHLGRESTRLIKVVCGRHANQEKYIPRAGRQQQQQGENNKTTERNWGGDNNAQGHLPRTYVRAQPSPDCVGKVRQAARGPMPLVTDENRSESCTSS